MASVLGQLWEQAKVAERAAENFRLLERVPVRLGVLGSIGPQRIAEPLAQYKHSFPHVDLEVHQGKAEEIARRLDAGEFDLAITSSPDDLRNLFHTKELYTESYIAVFPAGHAFEKKTEVTIDDVQGHPDIDRLACELRESVVAMCAERNVELYAAFRSEREDWIQSMVAAGIGFALMPECSVTHPALLSNGAQPSLRRRIARVACRQLRNRHSVSAVRR